MPMRKYSPTSRRVDSVVGKFLSANWGTVRKHTHRCYARILDKFVSTHRYKNIEDLFSGDVRQFLADREAEGLKPNTVRLHHEVLMLFFEWCVSKEFVDYNPADRLPLAKQDSDRLTPIEDKKIAALLQAAKDNPFELLYVLLPLTEGLTPTQLASLQWSDLDARPLRDDVRKAASDARLVLESRGLSADPRYQRVLAGLTLGQRNARRRVWKTLLRRAHLPTELLHDQLRSTYSSKRGAGWLTIPRVQDSHA